MATRLVMGAWPLKPGKVFPSDLGRVLVRNASNVEVPVAVQASRALFPDGSCRSVHVQFEANLTIDTPVQWTMTINGSRRTTTDRSWQEPVYNSGDALAASMANNATFVPAESEYWCDTFAALVPLKPEADEVDDAAKTYFRTSSGTNSTLGQWSSLITSNSSLGLSTYEHMHGYYCAAVRADSGAKRRAYYERFWKTLMNRCGGDTYWRIGSTITPPYTHVWAADNTLPAATNTNDTGLFSEPNSNDALGVAVGYIATGWKQPWKQVSYFASWRYQGAVEATAINNLISSTWTVRFNISFTMSFNMAAYVIGATMQVPSQVNSYGNGRDNDTASWSNDLTWMLDGLEDYIYTTANSAAYLDGIVGQRPTATSGGALSAGVFPTFQLFVAAKCLIFYYDNIKNDARIPVWLKTMADFVIGQMLDATTYYQQPYLHNATPSTAPDKSPYYLPFYSQLFAWVYADTQDATYQTWAVRAANARELENPSRFSATIKALGEYFGGNMQSAKFHIDGGAVRPIPGAHPTAITTRTTYTS